MRFALVFALIASAAFGQGRVTDRACAVQSRRSSRGGIACSSYAMFEFAPPSGVGMGAACACTTPSGAKGEVLNFTRASTAFCAKGDETTGIANGDLVECASGQPRVGTGGSGALKLGVWEARTNSALRSQEFDNASWVKQNSGSALPIVTADQAVAPDVTTTADRVQIAACPVGGNYSLAQSSTLVGTSVSASLYVRGVSGAGSIGVAINSAGGPNGFIACAFVSTSWTRCSISAAGASATTSMFFGCGNAAVGMTSTGAADVYVWGAQLESGASASPYIKTAGTSAARVAETANFALSGITTTASIAASFVAAPPFTTLAGVVGIQTNGVSPALGALMNGTTSLQCFQQGGLGFLALGGTQSVTDRVYCANTAGAYPVTNGLAGKLIAFTQQTGNGASLISVDRVGIGSWSDAHQLNGWVGQVCVDPDPTRCR